MISHITRRSHELRLFGLIDTMPLPLSVKQQAEEANWEGPGVFLSQRVTKVMVPIKFRVKVMVLQLSLQPLLATRCFFVRHGSPGSEPITRCLGGTHGPNTECNLRP